MSLEREAWSHRIGVVDDVGAPGRGEQNQA
jgi:hypothetical protein